MQSLNLPTYFFRIKEVKGKKYIFDEIRRRFVLLSPEEWVRQHMVRFLTTEKNFPRQLISIEKGFHYNRLAKRYDLLVYSRTGNPLMIVECKAPGVEIGQKVFDQASRYNITYQADYLLVTNGNKHYCCHIRQDRKGYEFLRDIPLYGELV